MEIREWESNPELLELLKRVHGLLVDFECAAAQRTAVVVHLPLLNAGTMKVLPAGLAVLQSLLSLAHLGETNDAIDFVLQIYFVLQIALLPSFTLALNPGLEALVQILTEFMVGGLCNLCFVRKAFEDLLVLCDLRDDEVDVFAGFALGAEVEAAAGHFVCHLCSVNLTRCPDNLEIPPLVLFALCI